MSRSDRRPAIDHLLLIAVPGIWIFLFLLLPVLTTAILSLSWLSISAFPYGDLPQLSDWPLAVSITDENYRFLWQSSGYVPALLNAIRIAATATSLSLMLGFPMAWGISRMPPRLRGLLLTLVIVPFWASMLVRIYSWNGIAGTAGTEFAVHLGIVYAYLPLMVLCIYASLVQLDYTRVEAASDLGGRPMQVFFRVILPASGAGMIAGCLLVFILAIGQFIVPDLLGSAALPMPGPLIWHEYFVDRKWPVAAAMALTLLVVLWGVAIPVGRYLLAAAAGRGARQFSLNESGCRTEQ